MRYIARIEKQVAIHGEYSEYGKKLRRLEQLKKEQERPKGAFPEKVDSHAQQMAPFAEVIKEGV